MDLFFLKKWLFQELNFGHINIQWKIQWYSERMAVVKIKICQVIRISFGFQNITTVKQARCVIACSGFAGVLFWKQHKRKSGTRFKRDDVIHGHAPSAVPSKVLSLANLPGQKRFFLVFT